MPIHSENRFAGAVLRRLKTAASLGFVLLAAMSAEQVAWAQSCPVGQQTKTYSAGPSPLLVAPWNSQTLTLSQFSAALGSLQSVYATASGTASTTGLAHAITAASFTVTSKSTITVSGNAPLTGASTFAVIPQQVNSFNVAAGITVNPYATVTGNASSNTGALTVAADIAPYIGAGTISYALSATNDSTISVVGGGFGTTSTSSQASVGVIYCYLGPDMTPTKTHVGSANFEQGQTGRIFTVTSQNVGQGPTDGSQVKMTDTLPAGLTATAITGVAHTGQALRNDWTCNLGTLQCTTNATVAANGFYDDIQITVSVAANAALGAATNTAVIANNSGGEVINSNNTATDNITIIASPSITCPGVTTGSVGVAYNGPALTVTGGTAPFTFSVVGALPAGLSLNTATGAVTGTPTASGNFMIKVTDANGQTATSCQFTIGTAPSITCPVVTTGTAGIAYAGPALTVTGGTAPYTFSVVGVLPAGLVLNPATGAVTGTPTAAGNFMIKVTDVNGATGTSCQFTISGPSITCPGVTSGLIGVAFNSPALTVVGGTAPLTFSVVGTLPAGLALNAATGAITGTPSAVGSFTVKVTDANGLTATSCVFSINPNAPPPAPTPDLTITKTHSGNFVQGQIGATFTITVSNVGRIRRVALFL